MGIVRALGLGKLGFKILYIKLMTALKDFPQPSMKMAQGIHGPANNKEEKFLNMYINLNLSFKCVKAKREPSSGFLHQASCCVQGNLAPFLCTRSGVVQETRILCQ
jgi:hypothetical protein